MNDHDEPMDPRLAEALHQLPEGIEPPAHLWSAIEPRLAADEERPPRPMERSSIGVRQILLAAAILMAGVGLGELVSRPNTPPSHLELVAAWEADLAEANAALLAQLAARDDLSPDTRAAIDRNLAVIDQAIAEVRAALQDDPDSGELGQWLASAYEQKQRVLRAAVQLPRGS